MKKKPNHEKLESQIIELQNEILALKEEKEQLWESEFRYKTVFESAGDAIFIHEMGNRFLEVNQAACDQTGYTKEEFLNMAPKTIIPGDKYSVPQNINKLLKKGHLFREGSRLRKDGTIIPVEMNSRVVKYDGKPAILTISRDISERKKTKQHLKQSKKEWETTFDAISDWVCLIDTDMIIIKSNIIGEKFVSFSLEDIVGKKCFELVHNSDDPLPECPFEKMKQTHKREIVELQLSKSDKWLLIEVDPVFDEKGKLTGAVHIVRDITEQKLVDEKNKRLEEQLRQSHKMEAIGTLSGGIAHEFNNILGIIVGNAELAHDYIPDSNIAAQNLEEIHKACLRAKDIVRQILTFSRQDNKKAKPVNFTLIVNESLKFLRSTLPKTIEFRKNLSASYDIINADSTQMNQVIINLCNNAAHAMQENGGILEVNLDNIIIDRTNSHFYNDQKTGHYVRLTIHDTGYGMPSYLLNKIFDPYFTTKEVGEGVRMGLAVAQGIIQKHSGTILVESREGKGSTFTVILPCLKDKFEEKIDKLPALQRGDESILLVEDERPMLDVYKPLIEGLGYNVIAMTDGHEALNLFQSDPGKYDLVITDETMPGMRGDELANKLMRIRSNMPIILCTGFSNHINREKALEMGIQAFVLKPITLRDLANTIRKVLDKN